MLKKIIKAFLLFRVIFAIFGFCALVVLVSGGWKDFREFLSVSKYKVDRSLEDYSWEGLKIKWTGPSRVGRNGKDDRQCGHLNWITSFNYTDKLMYGKTPVWWFVITADEKTRMLDELILFADENKFKGYLAGQNIQIKELMEAPVFKIPELSNGYYLLSYGDLLRGPTWYAAGIDEVGVFNDFVVGKGKKGGARYPDSIPEGERRWFVVDMNKEGIHFKNSLDEISSFTGVEKKTIEAGLKKWGHIDYHKEYPLPFQDAIWNSVTKSDNVAGVSYKEGYSRYNAGIRFIVYFKRQKGYIFGRSWHEYFIFNTKDEKCLFFNKEDDWRNKLKELKLRPKFFIDLGGDREIAGFEQEPWLDSMEHYNWAKRM